MTAASGQPPIGPIQMSDLPEPATTYVLTVAGRVHGPPVPAKQRIYFYSPDEWEEFVREWAKTLPLADRCSGRYLQVKRLGGANDHGADVAAFLTPQQFEGDWDCFQCKHYSDVLRPADAWPEILKVLQSVVLGLYTLPRRYVFVAPMGCGGSLDRLLSTPTELRVKFIEQFHRPKSPLGAALPADVRDKILTFAATLDFSMFQSADIDEVLAVHKLSPNHVMRFGGALPQRPSVDTPPDDPADHESRYVAQLLRVYREHFGPEAAALDGAKSHPKAASHLLRQREAFYSAESLERFARDAVPKGTFAKFRDEVYDGVIEVHSANHIDGMARLTQVLQAAVSAQLPSNALIETSDARDRKGICHQLANIEKLVWCENE
ncbi:hypothetical protein Aca07nite_57540 [Actinoplanes capillaceus]|uniref:ABC-three component systems C-terminal domain-containing protein n=1 Tax=Actinoplanes campanulatus TaxID=113559 RepID=A0ABQ3WQL1_9ACTN|nr:ABC-three component system protein [Actinoplanes capillaceus]GID48479.1 hypothetical protein Aca07nite_57540 [Actinoplanes capillaceus]